MSIKQQGGIFGRNPTFNNLNVDGTLTVDQIVERTGAAGITLDGVTLKDGNVVLANGKGIDFSATAGTGTSELFDDYEEGEFIPTVTPSVSGTISVNSSVRALSYVKIGSMVFISGSLRIYSVASPVGSINLTLPFAAADLLYESGECIGVAAISQAVSKAAGAFVIRVLENGTSASIQSSDGTAFAADAAQELQGPTPACYIKVSLAYRAA